MWHQQHQNPGGGMPMRPPGPPNPNDWASAAQQWMNNKVFYEQWQQQQYQQHMQMMAASHAAQMAQSIDPTVVTNPPPPPPLPSDEPSLASDSASPEAKPSGTPSKFRNQHLVNNPKTAAKLPYMGKEPSKSGIFAAYDKVRRSLDQQTNDILHRS
jgi:hypothetical protein